jgi:hypothetical protein
MLIEPPIKFKRARCGHPSRKMAAYTHQHQAMLQILYGACATALDAFRAADNPVDEELVGDLEKMVERTEGEMKRLAAQLASPRNGG